MVRELERYCWIVFEEVWESGGWSRDELGGVVEMLQGELFGQ